MPRRTTSRKPTQRAARRQLNAPAGGPLLAAIRTTLHGAEAVSVGLVHAATETVVVALRGVRAVGAQLGSSAVSAARGSISATGAIGSALGRLTNTATAGVVDAGAVGRVAAEAVQGAAHAVQSVGAGAAEMLGFGRPAVSSRRQLSAARSRSGARRQRRASGLA
jgi:hypothetical protein